MEGEKDPAPASSRVSPYDLQGVAQTVPSPAETLDPTYSVKPGDPYDLSRTQIDVRKGQR